MHKYLAAEIGVENFLLPYDNYSRLFSTSTRERVTLLRFELRETVPVADGRVELSAGTGGAVLWSSEDSLGHPYDGSRLLWPSNAGTRADLGRPTQQWVSLTADFSYRFGR